MNENAPNISTNSGPAPRAAREGVERIAKGAHSGIDAASKAAHPAIDRMASGAHKVVDNADEVATHAADALGKAGVRGEELVAAGAGYIRAHPVLTLTLAVATGYVLSRLFSSR